MLVSTSCWYLSTIYPPGHLSIEYVERIFGLSILSTSIHTVQLPTLLAGALRYVRYLRVLRMLTQNVTKPHSLFTEFAATVHSRLMTPARTKLIRRCF